MRHPKSRPSKKKKRNKRIDRAPLSNPSSAPTEQASTVDLSFVVHQRSLVAASRFLFNPPRGRVSHETTTTTTTTTTTPRTTDAATRARQLFVIGPRGFASFFPVLGALSVTRLDGAQWWLPWPTGTDWRCKPRSSRPRATSQWPTHGPDRSCSTFIPSPRAPSAFCVKRGPKQGPPCSRNSPLPPRVHGIAALCHRFHFFSLSLSVIFPPSFPRLATSLFAPTSLRCFERCGSGNRWKRRESLNDERGRASRVYFGGSLFFVGNVPRLLMRSFGPGGGYRKWTRECSRGWNWENEFLSFSSVSFCGVWYQGNIPFTKDVN